MAAEMSLAKDSPDKALEAILDQLGDNDAETRESAVARLSFFGSETILAVASALNDEAAQVRAAARSVLFTQLAHPSISPRLRKGLQSRDAKQRLEAIQEIAKVVPEIRQRMKARAVGWQALDRLLRPSYPVMEDSMQNLKEPRNPKGKSAARSAVPDWKPHLNSYQEKQLLRFASDTDLHGAIELLWTEPFLNLPHCTPDGRSIVVPAEAVEYLGRAGLKFTASRLRSISDLTPDEISKVRR